LNQNPQNEPEDVEPISTILPPTTNQESSENDPSEEEDIQQTQTEPVNVEGTITPNPTIVVPSQADTPPAMVRSKKSKSKTKSLDSSRIRRSARIMSGIGTGKKPIKDNTVHVIDDDSENTLSDNQNEAGHESEDEPEIEVVTSTKSLPPKPSPVSIKKPPIDSKISKAKEKIASASK
jgi:hypothetical protein